MQNNKYQLLHILPKEKSKEDVGLVDIVVSESEPVVWAEKENFLQESCRQGFRRTWHLKRKNLLLLRYWILNILLILITPLYALKHPGRFEAEKIWAKEWQYFFLKFKLLRRLEQDQQNLNKQRKKANEIYLAIWSIFRMIALQIGMRNLSLYKIIWQQYRKPNRRILIFMS